MLHTILAQVQAAGNSVTVTFDITDVLTWLIIGFIAGTLAELLIRGRGRGIFANIIIGLIGAFVGGLLLKVLHPTVPSWLAGGITLTYFNIVVAFVGAVIVLIILGLIFRRRA